MVLAFLGVIALLAAGFGALAVLRNPWEPVNLSYRAPSVPALADLEDWLNTTEAAVPSLRPDARKQILWAGEPGQKTALSVVYVHGFSAAAPELRPVPDRIAAELGANLYFTRLSGHGRDGAAMAEPRVRDWADDLAEAIEIGRRLGDRVLVIGSSMGGALVTLAALDPDYGADVAGLVLVAPAYRLPPPGGAVITLPFARLWGPLAIGETRRVTPRSDAHEAAWTLTYPTVSVLPLGALVKVIGRSDMSKAAVPALFFYAENDQVVDPAATAEIASNWGARKDVVVVSLTPEDDMGGHVLAGDILSPAQTGPMVSRVVQWVRGL